MFGNGSKDEDNIAAEALRKRSTEYSTLREANVARQELWDPAGLLKDWSWRANELAGEAGEVCNVLKKLHRAKLGLPGSRTTYDALADELADVMICVDLCRMQLGIPPAEEHVRADAWGHNLPELGCELINHVGRAVIPHLLKNYTRGGHLNNVIRVVMHIAQVTGVNLNAAVAYKFNQTSVKVGLPVILRSRDAAEDFANAVQGSSS